MVTIAPSDFGKTSVGGLVSGKAFVEDRDPMELALMLARQNGAGLERTLVGHERDRGRALGVRLARRFSQSCATVSSNRSLPIEVSQRVRLDAIGEHARQQIAGKMRRGRPSEELALRDWGEPAVVERDLIAVVKSRVPRRPGNDDGGDYHDSALIQVLLDPAQKLRDTVNLIVVASVGKTKQLIEKVVQPGGVSRQMDLAGFDLR